MRSHLVYLAKAQMPNRFELVRVAAWLARGIHKPNTCLGASINQALERIAASGEREGE